MPIKEAGSVQAAPSGAACTYYPLVSTVSFLLFARTIRT